MSETTTPKRGRKSAEEKAELPALDLGALTIEAAEVPAITRTRDEKPNPFVAALVASYQARKDGNEKAGNAVTVPTARAGEVKYLIRQAGKRAAEVEGFEKEIGARIVETDNGDGTTRIVFAGKDKRAVKATENGQAEDAPSE